jgi:hypothetical protein
MFLFRYSSESIRLVLLTHLQIFSDVGLMTGDVTINPAASCLVMTTEVRYQPYIAHVFSLRSCKMSLPDS